LWALSVGNIFLVSAPYLILPYLVDAEGIGRFAAAHRLVALSATVSVALSAVFDRIFAQATAQGNTVHLKKTFQRSQLYAFIAYLPIWVLYFSFPREILAMFGQEFRDAAGILLILATGRLVNSALGLTERYLIMTRREGVELFSELAAAIVFVVAGTMAGIAWGLTGVAIAYSFAFAMRSVISYIAIIKGWRRPLDQVKSGYS
jgi:O-antigen/teichoic acid export membrane protein